MRTNLKLFRVKLGLSQEEISHDLDCCRATYSAIENGTRRGNMSFWNKLQERFAIPSCEMWELMKDDE